MSDFGPNPSDLDPDSEALIWMLAMNGVQPQGLLDPYSKDPLSGLKTRQTALKSDASLLGFNPIEQYAGPEVKQYVPEADSVRAEAEGDPIAQELLARLDNGEGLLALRKKIAAKTYDPTKQEEPAGGGLTVQEAKAYSGWLDRMSKAIAKDNINLSKPGVVTDPAEADPYANVPTDAAKNFNEEDYISGLRQRGEFGRQINRNVAMADVAPGVEVPGSTTEREIQRQYRSLSPASKAEERGYQAREAGFRSRAQSAVQNSTRPSLSKERAIRGIIALRLAYGLPAT